MKKLILVAALGLGLAACNDTAEDTDAATDEAAAPAEAAPAMVTANGSMAGLYEVTAADGTVTQSELIADGTYMDHGPDGNVTETGTWSVVDGKTCFDPEGDEAATCYTETAPDADGVFTATPDEGEAVTVRRAEV
jgi:hypothetical protein